MFSRREALKILMSSAFTPSLFASNGHNKWIRDLGKTVFKKQKGVKKLVVLNPQGSEANVIEAAKAFKELTGIEIELKQGSLDQISSEVILSSKLSDPKDYFDIALPATFNIPNLVDSKAIIDLTDFARKYEPNFYRDDYLYLRGGEFSGRLYGYQTDGDTYLTFINKKFLSEKKTKEYEQSFSKKLSPPKTWAELDRQLKFFHDPDNKQFGGALYRNKNYGIWEFWIRLHSKGIFPVDKSFHPNISKPEAVEALEEYIKASQYLIPRNKELGLFDNFKAYGKGNIYLNFGWGGSQKYFNGEKSQVKDSMIFDLLPGAEKNGKTIQMPYFNWGWNYVVSSRSKYPELSYLFCLFACSPKISIRSVRESGGYFDPFRNCHYEDKKIQETYSKDFLKVHKESLLNSIPDFYVLKQGLYLAALKDAIFAADQKRLSPKKALEMTANRWEKITETIGREKQISYWKNLRKSYPQNLNGFFNE